MSIPSAKVQRPTIAKHDPAMSIMPICRSGYRHKPIPGLDLKQTYAGATLRVMGPYFITPSQLLVLLVLLQMAEKCGALVSPAVPLLQDESSAAGLLEKEDAGAQPVTIGPLAATGVAEKKAQVLIETTYTAFSREVYGYDPGDSQISEIKEALTCLGAITVSVNAEDRQAQSPMLCRESKRDGLRIWMNWKLAQAISGGHHTRINIDDFRTLTTDAAKILFPQLSSLIRPGKEAVYGYDTLAERLWGATEKDTKSATLRKRYERVRNALREIGQLRGWQIDIGKSGARVRRAPVGTSTA